MLVAVSSNRLDSIHILLKWGARVNEATNEGETALHSACKKRLADVTALLLKFGADLNARNQEGKTPFELLPNSPSGEATGLIIIRESIKREALGQSLCEGYYNQMSDCENYWNFELDCREEVEQMRFEKIDAEDSDISFFDIFSMNQEKLTGLARDETIVTAFESSDYKGLFRIYADELTTKFEVAKKHANLPASVMRKIAAYVKYGYIIENNL